MRLLTYLSFCHLRAVHPLCRTHVPSLSHLRVSTHKQGPKHKPSHFWVCLAFLALLPPLTFPSSPLNLALLSVIAFRLLSRTIRYSQLLVHFLRGSAFIYYAYTAYPLSHRHIQLSCHLHRSCHPYLHYISCRPMRSRSFLCFQLSTPSAQ